MSAPVQPSLQLQRLPMLAGSQLPYTHGPCSLLAAQVAQGVKHGWVRGSVHRLQSPTQDMFRRCRPEPQALLQALHSAYCSRRQRRQQSRIVLGTFLTFVLHGTSEKPRAAVLATNAHQMLTQLGATWWTQLGATWWTKLGATWWTQLGATWWTARIRAPCSTLSLPVRCKVHFLLVPRSAPDTSSGYRLGGCRAQR